MGSFSRIFGKIALWLILCGISSVTYATKLVNINSVNQAQTQIISFKFDSGVQAPKIFTAEHDLIVDFISVGNGMTQNKINLAGGIINSVGVFSSNDKLRAVILGGAAYKYTVNSKLNQLDITFSNKLGNVSISSNKIGLIESNLANSTVLINDVKFSRDNSNGGLVEFSYSGDGQIMVDDKRVGNSLQIDLLGANIDSKFIKKLDVSDFATPIKYIETNKYHKGVRLLISNDQTAWDYAVYQLQGKLIINVRSLQQNNSQISNNPNNEKTNKVSLNFQNIDVRALLQLMADFSGYNVLVSDGVKGTMSLKLNDVPWNQALTIILNAKGLGMRQEGNVIRIAPLTEITDIDKQELDTKTASEAVETLETVTWRLKYTQVNLVQTMLQKPFGFDDKTNKATSLLSNRGSVLIDARTNTLIVNDVPSRIQAIRELINKIDIPVKMVLIEARIVEANSDFERSLGTRLFLSGITGGITYSNTLENAVNINQNGINTLSSNAFTNGSSSSGSSSSSSDSSSSSSSGGTANTNFGTAATSSIAMIFSPNSNNLIGLEIDALEAQNSGKTISSPKVMTANYQVASIQQGVQIPYQQLTSTGNTSIAFINAVLSLRVTPQITDDGNILLNVDIHKDTPNTKLVVQGTPSIDTNSVTTGVQVLDGSTILVGGVYIDDQQHVEDKVPWLGDIPYLGWLFKSVYDSTNKKELLIFITPKIISNTLNDDNV